LLRIWTLSVVTKQTPSRILETGRKYASGTTRVSRVSTGAFSSPGTWASQSPRAAEVAEGRGGGVVRVLNGRCCSGAPPRPQSGAATPGSRTLQRQQVIFDHVPDCIPVDPEIVVDEDVPHPDDRR